MELCGVVTQATGLKLLVTISNFVVQVALGTLPSNRLVTWSSHSSQPTISTTHEVTDPKTPQNTPKTPSGC